MKLEAVEIDNYRAIEHLRLPLDPSLTVLHGDNTCGKTSVLSAIAVGLGVIPERLLGSSGIDFLNTDVREGESFGQVDLTAVGGLSWNLERFLNEDLEALETTTHGLEALKESCPKLSLRTAKRTGPWNSPLSLSTIPTGLFSTFRRVGVIPVATFLPLRCEWWCTGGSP